MKKIRSDIIKALFAVLVFATITQADQTIDEQNCSTKDFSASFGPVRDQGNIGWCYANVAADMLTYRYKNELQGRRVSAGYVALAFNEVMWKKPNDDAGDVIPAVLAAEYFGVCTTDFEEAALKSGPFETIRDKINNLVLLKTVYDKKKKNPAYRDPFEAHLNRYISSNSLINKISREELEYTLRNSSVRTFPRKLADRICDKDKKKLKFKLDLNFEFFLFEGIKNFIFQKGTDVSKSGKAGIINSINKQISRDKPVAAAYKTNIFYEPGSDYYKNAGSHVSVLVGRRWNKQSKTCEFLLRNSWGKNCYSYSNPELKGKCDPNTGYVWLSSEILKRSVTEAVYFRGSP